MAKNIFVSYNFNDPKVKSSVREMIQRENLKGQIVVVENDVSYNGATAIDWEIEHTMQRCDAALFVIGDNPRNSPWINEEAAHAIAKNIPVLATQLPDMDGETPSALTDSTFINWDAEALTNTLNRC
ncbi:MAG: toll/interleukin-1 receptor domain-containing protein [Algicola sp.]|nr:toll/interleukin-1 receptor domain-containing protein [Algicola sp.]